MLVANDPLNVFADHTNLVIAHTCRLVAGEPDSEPGRLDNVTGSGMGRRSGLPSTVSHYIIDRYGSDESDKQ